MMVGAQLAVSSLMIKGAKEKTANSPCKMTSKGKGKKSMSSHSEVLEFWMCPKIKLGSREGEFAKKNALLNLVVSFCCRRYLCL